MDFGDKEEEARIAIRKIIIEALQDDDFNKNRITGRHLLLLKKIYDDFLDDWRGQY